MNIVNVGYDSTNYYVIADSRPKLLVDVGWPGTLPKLTHECKRMGIGLADLKHFMVTHFHPDHAGLAEELKRTGCKLVVLDLQIPFVAPLKTVMKPQNHYLDIDLADAVTITLDASRAFLASIGIQGEIVETPGHTDDSVTLILDEGAAFTGDLTYRAMADETGLRSWEKIRALGAKMAYPGHGPAYPLTST